MGRWRHITCELDVVEGQGNGDPGTTEIEGIDGHVADRSSHSQWITRWNEFDLQKQWSAIFRPPLQNEAI
jgi:hypothetical protein